MNINQKLKLYIDEKNMTSEEFECTTGLSRVWIESLMDKNTVRLESIRRLCDGFGVSLAEVFREGEEIFDLDDEQMRYMMVFNGLLPEKQEFVLEYARYVAKNN